MFTGLVEGITPVLMADKNSEGLVLRIEMQTVLQELNIGDSLSVNGVCLTVTERDPQSLCFQVIAETLDVTDLGNLIPTQTVNYERALSASARLGGHFVLGHVDAISTVLDCQDEGMAKTMFFSLEKQFLPYVVKKGQIAIDGMSLTIVAVYEDSFSVSFIPHTQAITVVSEYKIGTRVNLECDIFAKYVHQSVERYKAII